MVMKMAVKMTSKMAMTVLAVLASVLSSSVGQAEPSAWVGGVFGFSIPNAENTSGRPIMGASGGAMIGTEFGVGAYYLSSAKDEDAGGTLGTVKFNYDFYGIMPAFYFEGEAKGVYLGGMIGTSRVSTRAGGENFSTSPMHYGLIAGYNKFLNTNFSLGGDFTWMAVPGSTKTLSTGQQTSVDDFSMLNFAVTGKFWF